MKRITASRLSLAQNCIYPWTSDLPWVDTFGAAAKVGTAFHTFAERHVVDGSADVNVIADEAELAPSYRSKLIVLARVWLDWLGDKDTREWAPELAFGVDPKTGNARTLKGKGHRDYSSVPDDWFVGTADVVSQTGGRLVVDDYKTGAMVDPPFVNPQMRFLALAAARTYDVPDVVARIIKVTTEGVHVMSAPFDMGDLATIEEQLISVDAQRYVPPVPHPGAHCRWCPVNKTCEAAEGKTMAAAVTKSEAVLSTGARGLGAVRKGRIEKPVRVLLYGVEGIGKSTFAGQSPSPIFIGAEDGTAQLDVHRFPEPKQWEDLFADVAELATAPHDYRTLVVDTLDWAEPLCWAHVCKQGGKKAIEDFGFGKGYVAAVEEWRRFLGALDDLRARRGMSIILLAHMKVATFKNPEGDDFDRYTLKLHDKSSGLIKEWTDAVLFAQHETFTHEKDKRVRGIDSGARVLHTQRRAAFDAKNRFDLPETIPLSWDEFAAGVKAHAPVDRARAHEQFVALSAQLSPADKEKADAALRRADNDPAKLAQLNDWLRGKVQIEQSQTTKESA